MAKAHNNRMTRARLWRKQATSYNQRHAGKHKPGVAFRWKNEGTHGKENQREDLPRVHR